MVGFAIGAACGVIQFWLLSRFTKLITTGKVEAKAVALGLLQFLLPVGVLVATAFIIRQELLWAGIGIVAALLTAAIIKFVLNNRKQGGRKDDAS